MGAKFIAGTVIGSPGFANCKVNDDETEFSFTYQPSFSGPKEYKAYVPTRKDYEVNLAVIDKAISLGCNLIVYDNWIFPTISGKHHARTHKIIIYSVPQFIRKIKNGKLLDG